MATNVDGYPLRFVLLFRLSLLSVDYLYIILIKHNQGKSKVSEPVPYNTDRIVLLSY